MAAFRKHGGNCGTEFAGYFRSSRELTEYVSVFMREAFTRKVRRRGKSGFLVRKRYNQLSVQYFCRELADSMVLGGTLPPAPLDNYY